MGTTSSAIFTGTSQFSTDFQNVITRAVNIATLPITQMQTSVTNLQSQSTALSGLDSNFVALQSAVQGIQNAIGGASYQTSFSTSGVVSASLANGVIAGDYTIDVEDIGAYSTSLTAKTWNNATGPAQTYQLYIGDTSNPSNEIDITPTDNSAQSVAAAINAKAGDKVRATVVNVGSPDGTADYRISLQSTSLTSDNLSLMSGGSDLQTQTPGRPARYQVNNSLDANGNPNIVNSSTRTVNIANGLTVNLLSSDPGTPVTITVSQSTSTLSNAVSAFVNAYNNAANAVTQQTGSTQGASLNGQSIVYELRQALSNLSTYSSPGSTITGLLDLGVQLQDDGTMTFDSSVLAGVASSNSAGLASFLGSTTDGGFLLQATNVLNGLEDPTSGLLKGAELSVQQQITDTTNQISTKQDQVTQLQTTLQQQMAAADAAIASMEQQYNYISGMFQAQQTADQQYSK